jgi:acetoin utilization protein AcuA
MHAGSTTIQIWRGLAAHAPVRIAGDFGAIVRSAEMPSLLGRIAAADGIVLAAVDGDELRGYATVVPSSALAAERWENLPHTYELGSMEVARSSRESGIGTALLSKLAATLPLEHILLFARGLVHHWDASLAALAPSGYRLMLLRMLGRAGFQRWETDDPEIAEHPPSFLAVRAGLEAPAASILALRERAVTYTRDPWW